jgi:sigma-B regulation protein RsbU (phosphoserine phosphatase)
VGEEVVGLVILGPKRSDEDYSAEDKQLVAATRLPLASALKTAALVDDKLFKDRVEQELKRAREVQEAMLPRAVPALPGFDFAASSVPCYEASGDYYDFVDLPDGRVGVAVADVAGKGIAAAMATAMAKSGLYNQSQTDPEVIPVMGALNRLLHAVSKHSAAKSFTTCIYALLDPTARKLTFSTAGHFPPHHYDATTGRITEFPLGGGFPLGVREKAKYMSYEVHLHPGDVLVFYTDGVTEAQAREDLPPGGPVEPGEMFESERLSAVLLANKHKSAEEIHHAIVEAVESFVDGGPQTDDITVVVVKVLDAPEQASV